MLKIGSSTKLISVKSDEMGIPVKKYICNN